MVHEECLNHFDALLVDVNHGGPDFGSVVHPTRFRQLAGAVNKLWQCIPKAADYVMVVESDLIWSADTLVSLLDGIEALRGVLSSGSAPTLLAPYIIDSEGYFYDVWAFRANGTRFDQIPPFFYSHMEGRYKIVDSVGSCWVVNAELARQLTWPEEDVVVGLCRQAKTLGAKIYVDTELAVRHP